MGDVVKIRPATIPPANLYEQVQIQLQYLCLQDVANACDLSAECLRKWVTGETENPYFPNVLRVAQYLEARS